MKRLSVAILGMMFVAGSFAPTAFAQGQTESARPLGMASAFTANASGNGAIYHNPAGVGTIFTYALEGSYLLTPGMNILNASVVDSKINPKFAAGMAYSYEFSNDKEKLTVHDGRLVLASPIIPKRLVLGVGGRYVFGEKAKDEIINGFTLDLGGIFRITDGIFIGVSGTNLIDLCQNDDTGGCPTGAAPRTVGGGLSFGSSAGFQLSGDVRADFSPGDGDVLMIYAGGLEILLAELLALRGGYQFRDLTKDHVMALGGGIKTKAVGLDVGFQQRFTTNETILSVAVQFYFF